MEDSGRSSKGETLSLSFLQSAGLTTQKALLELKLGEVVCVGN